MIKAAASLEPGDIIDVTGDREVITSVDAGPDKVYVSTAQGNRYLFNLTRTTRTYQPVAPLKTCSTDRLYINELEHRVRKLEAKNQYLIAFVEIVAAGNTEADVLAIQAKRELNR